MKCKICGTITTSKTRAYASGIEYVHRACLEAKEIRNNKYLEKLPKRFKKVKDGQWVQPVLNGYLMKCCDCGLVHELDFLVIRGKTEKDDRVKFRAKRV